MEKGVISSLNPQTPGDPGAQGQILGGARWFQRVPLFSSVCCLPLGPPSILPRPLCILCQLPFPVDLLGSCPSPLSHCLPPVSDPPSFWSAISHPLPLSAVLPRVRHAFPYRSHTLGCKGESDELAQSCLGPSPEGAGTAPGDTRSNRRSDQAIAFSKVAPCPAALGQYCRAGSDPSGQLHREVQDQLRPTLAVTAVAFGTRALSKSPPRTTGRY